MIEIFGAEECAQSDGSPLIECTLGNSNTVVIEADQDRCHIAKPYRKEYWPTFHYKSYAEVPLKNVAGQDKVTIDPNDPKLRCKLNYNRVTN